MSPLNYEKEQPPLLESLVQNRPPRGANSKDVVARIGVPVSLARRKVHWERLRAGYDLCGGRSVAVRVVALDRL